MISIYLVKLGIEVHINGEWAIKILEQGMLHIFLGKQRFLCGDLPIYTQTLIEDADSSVGLWGVEVIALVLEDGSIAEHSKAMSKTSRNKELTMIVPGEFYCYMLTIGRTAFTDIYCYIEYATLDTTYQFTLSEGRCLEMQSSHHSVR